MCRRIFLACLFLFVLGVAGLGLLYWDITRRDPQSRPSASSEPTQATGSPAASGAPSGPVASAPEAAPSPTSPTVPEAAPEARHAEQTVKRIGEQFEGRGPHGEPPTDPHFEVRISEGEATEMIRSLPEVRKSLEKARIDAPEIRFQEGRLMAGARVPVYAGIQTRVSLKGRVEARDGRLTYETDSVSIGSLPAPRPVRDALDKQIRTAVEKLNGDFKGRVDEVSAADGTLVIRGERPPVPPG